MKTISFIILTFLAAGLLLPEFASAQARPYPDSVRVELPQEGAIVIFEMRRYAKDTRVISTFGDRLADITTHIKNSIPESQWAEEHTVVVTPDNTDDTEKRSHITITRKNEDVTRLRVQESSVLELLPPGWDITIHTARAVVHVYAPDLPTLDVISRKDFQSIITHLVTTDEFVTERRMGVYTRLIMSDDGITTAGTPGHRLPADMLGIHAGAGVGIAGDRFYPEFNSIIALYFANRFHNNRQRIAAGYELKLFSGRTAENEFRSRPASFVTLSYGINFSGQHPRWTALGVGYMVHNRSDMFTGKTLKLFIESDIGSKKLNLVPELYLTDDFSKSIFGMKLHYKF